MLKSSGFNNIRSIPLSQSSELKSALLATSPSSSKSMKEKISLFRFSPMTELDEQIKIGLQGSGWEVTEHTGPVEDVQPNQTLLILDDLSCSVLSHISRAQWAAFKSLTALRNKVLWVTEGSHFAVTKPENATIHGFLRTIREEDPNINFTTLDVEQGSGEHTIPTINTLLEFLHGPASKKSTEFEFVERQGVISIGRVFQDYALNKFTQSKRNGAELVSRPLHGVESTLQLQCERVGNLESLHFVETRLKDYPLAEEEIEIEIVAAGMNFKDIAVSTGLIPENQRLLGHEGSGTVKRSRSPSYSVGQRVVFSRSGAYANRIIATTEQVHLLPDSMSFEEAATLAGVYSVAIYSLFDLANTRAGQRVLIHSAAGGLGIACIQLCRYLGAEVYATVGNSEKRRYLSEHLGVPSSRIFDSRTTGFSEEILDATNNEGIDVIINSLVGDLLEASWACIRDGGTMVELGKKDIIDRNYLPMEPFAKNVSYRSFDISHRCVPNSLRAR